MGKERIETTFSKEEVEIISSSLLECYTHYGYKITELKTNKLKANDIEEAEAFQQCIDYYTERHNVLGKFLSFMRGSCE